MSVKHMPKKWQCIESSIKKIIGMSKRKLRTTSWGNLRRTGLESKKEIWSGGERKYAILGGWLKRNLTTFKKGRTSSLTPWGKRILRKVKEDWKIDINLMPWRLTPEDGQSLKNLMKQFKRTLSCLKQSLIILSTRWNCKDWLSTPSKETTTPCKSSWTKRTWSQKRTRSCSLCTVTLKLPLSIWLTVKSIRQWDSTWGIELWF